MMTALGMTADGKRLLLLGLTDGNLRRLRAGAPIVMNDTTGHACPKGWEICILHGATEEDLQAILKRSGAMKADCQIEDKRPSSN